VLLNASTLAFAGCRLIDQTSFGGAPQTPAPKELTAALVSQSGSPVFVVSPDDAVPYWDSLRQVVRAAEARDANVRFRVESVVPGQANLRAQQSALEANTAAARQFVDYMGAAGVNADRIRLEARTEAHLLRREIRLYQE
jgi:ABC-type sugar transport system substrate-binding protein